MTNDELIALLKRTPEGILSADLRRILKLNGSHEYKRLARIRDAGVVFRFGYARYARWCAVEHIATAMAADAEYREEERRQSNAKRQAYERSRIEDPERRAKRALWQQINNPPKSAQREMGLAPLVGLGDDSIDSWPVVQRWVAAAAPMMAKPGPSSVWDLAA